MADNNTHKYKKDVLRLSTFIVLFSKYLLFLLINCIYPNKKDINI